MPCIKRFTLSKQNGDYDDKGHSDLQSTIDSTVEKLASTDSVVNET